MDYFEIFIETRNLCENLFNRLSKGKKDYSKLQKLERDLSNSIYDCEVNILKYKNIDIDIENGYRQRRCILKRISDGLAWIVFGFDPDYLLESSRERSPGFMGGKLGYDLERRALEDILEMGQVKFGLQNDITNCIRNKGDLSFLLMGNRIFPLEIKSSDRGVRKFLKDQEKRNEKLENQMICNAYNPITEEDYNWSLFKTICNDSVTKGYGYGAIDEVVFVIYHEYPFPISEKEISKLYEHPFFKDAHPKIFELSDMFNYKENSELNYILPPTAFNIPPKIISNVFSGSYNVKIIFDYNKMKNKIERETGFIVHFDERYNIHLNLNDEIELTISHRKILPIIYSFQKSDYLIKSTKEILNNMDNYKVLLDRLKDEKE